MALHPKQVLGDKHREVQRYTGVNRRRDVHAVIRAGFLITPGIAKCVKHWCETFVGVQLAGELVVVYSSSRWVTTHSSRGGHRVHRRPRQRPWPPRPNSSMCSRNQEKGFESLVSV